MQKLPPGKPHHDPQCRRFGNDFRPFHCLG
jgi:hypothetical protein